MKASTEKVTTVTRRDFLATSAGAGAVMMGVGSAAATFGFIWSYSQYDKYYWETDEVMYGWARSTNAAGFAIGVAGASLAGTGLILLVAPSKKNTTALTPGPVTTLTMEF